MSVVARSGIISALIWMLVSSTHAAFVLGSTRIVFDEDDRDVSLAVTNTSSIAYAGQVWLDPFPVGEKYDGEPPSYFAVTPPLFRLESGKEQLLRFFRTEGVLPKDKESVFWLNVQEIPPQVKGKNVVQFAQRVRIKLFYRPRSMLGTDSREAARKLGAAFSGGRLALSNNSPFSISFIQMVIKKGGKEWSLKEPAMILPKHMEMVSLPPGVTPPFKVYFRYISDYGGHHDGPILEVKG